MSERPAFVEVPIAGGGTISAVVATRDGIAEVMLNGVPHIGLLLSINAASATIAICTPDEALGISQRLSLAALTLKRRIGGGAAPAQRRDVSGLEKISRLHADDHGSDEFEVLDEKGQPVRDVLEVNVDEGWIMQLMTDEEGAAITNGDKFCHQRVRGTFTIRRVGS